MRSSCEAVKSGKVKYKGRASDEWDKDGKPQYYCYGYIDKMTDELIPECESCKKHVNNAQEDLERWKLSKQG